MWPRQKQRRFPTAGRAFSRTRPHSRATRTRGRRRNRRARCGRQRRWRRELREWRKTGGGAGAYAEGAAAASQSIRALHDSIFIDSIKKALGGTAEQFADKTRGARGSPSAAKAAGESKPVIAAVNRCATQNQAIAAVNGCATQTQMRNRFFLRSMEPCPSRTDL